jgi:hypothetical protein
MHRPATVFVVILTATALSAHANAQTLRPPPEIGIGMNRLVPASGDYSTDEFSEPTGHVRLTIPFARHFGFEAIATVGRRDDDYWTRTEGLYILQVKQSLGRFDRRSLQPFITYGAVGHFAHVVDRYIQRQGANVRTASFVEIEPPVATMVGVGLQQRLGRRVAIRADAQLLTFVYVPLGCAFSTSVSIPLRPFDSR